MLKGIFSVLEYIKVALSFIAPLTLLAEATGDPGPEKRAMVVDKLKVELDKLELTLPTWLERFVEPLLGLMVDVVVYILNQDGFFEPGSEG